MNKLYVLFLSVLLVLPIGAIHAQQKPGKGVAPSGRIVGGADAEISQIPWQVSLNAVFSSNNYDGHFCGGTLIDPFWVLTAAHCLDGTFNLQELKVVMSVSSLLDPGAIEIPVSHVIIHPAYNSQTYDNDIALLRLSRPAPVDQLPPGAILPFATQADLTRGLLTPGRIGIASGWGNILSEGESFPERLQMVELPIMSTQQGQQAYGSRFTGNMFAAGFPQGGKDACQGDSGGPFAVRNFNGNGWILAGIVSWGDGCAQPGSPGVYTNVGVYEEWIRNHTDIGAPPPTRFPYDVAILSVRTDLVNNQISLCGDEQFAQAGLSIINRGTQPLNNVTIRAFLNLKDYPKETLYEEAVSFDTPLQTDFSTYVPLPSLAFSITGNYILSIEAEIPSQTDGSPVNNAFTDEIVVSDGNSLSVEALLDDYPYETYWYVTEAASGRVMYSSQPFRPSDRLRVVTEELCLPDGSYIFTVEDLAADGLEPPAFVKLVLRMQGQENVLAEVKGNFGESVSAPFSIPFTPRVNVSVLLNSPEDGSDLVVCEPEMEVAFSVINNGTLPVSSFDYAIRIGTAQPVIRTWNAGILNSGNTVRLLHTERAAAFGPTTLSVEITRVNLALSDADPEDNRVTSRITLQQASRPVNFSVITRTDSYPNETTWEIFQAGERNRPLARSGVLSTPLSELTRPLCLQEGPYDIILYDAASDGIFDRESALSIQVAGAAQLDLNGDFSNQISGTFTLLAPPQGLTASPSSTPDAIVLTWTDRSNLESGYELERAEQGSNLFTKIASLPANTTTYTDSSLPLVQSFAYRIRAIRETFFSAYSNTSTAITSVEEQAQEDISLYPNPTRGEFFIQLPEHTSGQRLLLTMHDLAGRAILRMEEAAQSSKKIQVPLPDVGKGVYIVTVFHAGRYTYLRIVIQ